jgi:hypothetical protein
MTGYLEKDVAGRSIYEFDILKHAANDELAKERLAERATVPQSEAKLELPERGQKIKVVTGQTMTFATSPACCSPLPTSNRVAGRRPNCATAKSVSPERFSSPRW